MNISAQDLKLPLLFSDHMVLQRNNDIRIWGWSTPRTNITVSLHADSRTTTANKNGRWETFLPAQKAGGPYVMEVSSGQGTLSLKDVYIGDVWLAGGQSNMEWKLNWVVDNWEDEVAESGNHPEIRFFEVPQTTAFQPQEHVPGGAWKLANPQNTGNFSAVAWYFAKLNHREQNVPVGIIESNWGGTPAEAWTPAKRLLEVDGYQEEAQKVLDPAIDWSEEFAENDVLTKQKWELVGSPKLGVDAGVQKPDYDDSGWQTVSIPTVQPLSDVVWLRRSFTVADAAIDSISLFTGDVVQESYFYINGEQVGEKSWQQHFANFQIDPELLKKGENVIALRAVNSWDNKVIVGGENNIHLMVNDHEIDLTGKWKYSNEVEPKMPTVTRYENAPGFLYNGMIHPLAGYSMKGVIWYQGENNVGAPQYYNELFEALIEEWRISWDQEEFPFLFVQLANYMPKQEQPTDSDWARLREAQAEALSLTNTGMATAIDIGVADDIHPRNKEDVGKRLWLAAQHVAFGENLTYSGPTYAGHVVEGNTLRLAFNHTGNRLTIAAKEKLFGFAIAGADKKFYWADGVKLEDNQLVIWSDLVKHPVAVRYGWADNPDLSLYNKEGLPAIPFRTDDW